MMRTSELKRELSWEQTYQQILKRKADRCLAAGNIKSSKYCDTYEDCMKSYENSVTREKSYKAELSRRKELPKMYAYKVASVIIALATFGHITIMQ